MKKVANTTQASPKSESAIPIILVSPYFANLYNVLKQKYIFAFSGKFIANIAKYSQHLHSNFSTRF